MIAKGFIINIGDMLEWWSNGLTDTFDYVSLVFFPFLLMKGSYMCGSPYLGSSSNYPLRGKKNITENWISLVDCNWSVQIYASTSFESWNWTLFSELPITQFSCPPSLSQLYLLWCILLNLIQEVLCGQSFDWKRLVAF